MDYNVPEQDLVVLAKKGDEKAFEILVNKHLIKLKGVVQTQYKLSDFDLDEVIQVALVKAWQRIESFKFESSFATWLCTIMRNETINFVKKRQVIQRNEIPAHRQTSKEIISDESDYEYILCNSLDQKLEENALTIIEKREQIEMYRQLLAEVFEKLNDHHREIIHMVMEEKKTYSEISQSLNIPIGTVMSRLYFARRNAQKLIKQYAERNDIQLSCVG